MRERKRKNERKTEKDRERLEVIKERVNPTPFYGIRYMISKIEKKAFLYPFFGFNLTVYIISFRISFLKILYELYELNIF